MTKGIFIPFIIILLTLTACSQKRQDTVVAPWGEITDTVPAGDAAFDLDEIQRSGELIVLTVTGPNTCYDYHGRHLGEQYLLAQRFADQLGVGLRIEMCRDSSETRRRLASGDGDILLLPMTAADTIADTAGRLPGGWEIGPDKDDLRNELLAWYLPKMRKEVREHERYLLSTRSVNRRIFSPMLNRAGGVISHYDAYFQRYAPSIRWDWRLLAAQCYQESTFDPRAHSWAGACGLMQIMPSTADHIGLSRTQIFHPEENIAAAVRYIAELQQTFADIPERSERTKFVLAAYNGGALHIRDAMALARKYGHHPARWHEVEPFVLGLSQPEYYNDPVVKNGYMRGSETVDYVRRIHERWNGYRGIKTTHHASGPSGTPQKAKRERKKKYQI